jgi:hypothetical protein
MERMLEGFSRLSADSPTPLGEGVRGRGLGAGARQIMLR